MWLVTLATATAGVDAEEDQERRHQEAAADAEHAGDEPDREPHREDDEDVDRQVGDRKVDLHGSESVVATPACGAGRRNGSLGARNRAIGSSPDRASRAVHGDREQQPRRSGRAAGASLSRRRTRRRASGRIRDVGRGWATRRSGLFGGKVYGVMFGAASSVPSSVPSSLRRCGRCGIRCDAALGGSGRRRAVPAAGWRLDLDRGLRLRLRRPVLRGGVRCRQR